MKIKKNEKEYKQIAIINMLKALVEKVDNMQKQMGYFSMKIEIMINDIKARNKVYIKGKELLLHAYSRLDTVKINDLN